MGNVRKRCHVLHVVQSLEVGGMENGIVNLANGMNKELFRVSICCLSHEGALAGRIADRRVSVFSMNWKSGVSFGLFLALAREFSAREVDVVHTHGWLSYIYGAVACKLAGIPTLINGEHGTFNLDKRRRRIAYWLLSLISDKFLTVSHSLKEELRRNLHIAEQKIVTIPNGVDSGRFRPGGLAETAGVKQRIGIPDSDRVIGTVGRLERVKNHEMLLHAFCALRQEFTGLRCLLVGDGTRRQELETLARQLDIQGHVHFLGKWETPEELYPVFDVFVLPSLSEGMSNTILEAMSCARPVVATDVGGNGELVQDGCNGFLVESGDVAGLARSVRTLLLEREQRQSFGMSSRNIVDERFSIDAMISAYEQVYLTTVPSLAR